MGQRRTNDNIPPVVKQSGTTLSLASTHSGLATRITVGGQQYKLSSSLTLSTATSGIGGIDAGSFTAGTIYNIFAVVSSGTPGLIISTATSPTGFSSSKFLGKLIAATGATISHVMNVGEAFVEYVYNTTTANSTDTTSFGYGIDGVAIGSYTGVQKRCRFLQGTLSNDSVLIEFYHTAVTNPQWMPLTTFTTAGTDTINALTFQSAAGYGCAAKYSGAGSTDLDLVFSAYAQQAGATYGSAGTPWSAYSAVKWRIKKVSGPVLAP